MPTLHPPSRSNVYTSVQIEPGSWALPALTICRESQPAEASSPRLRRDSINNSTSKDPTEESAATTFTTCRAKSDGLRAAAPRQTCAWGLKTLAVTRNNTSATGCAWTMPCPAQRAKPGRLGWGPARHGHLPAASVVVLSMAGPHAPVLASNLTDRRHRREAPRLLAALTAVDLLMRHLPRVAC
jgi:hypothetical protein